MTNRNALVGLLVVAVVGLAGYVGYLKGLATPREDPTESVQIATPHPKVDVPTKQHVPIQLVKRSDVLYQGKPASHWLEVLKDRDQKTMIGAMRALAGIAEVDHSVIPAVIGALEGLRTDENYKESQTYRARGEEILNYLLTHTSLDAREKATLVPHLVRALKARPDVFPTRDLESSVFDWHKEDHWKPIGFLYQIVLEDQKAAASPLASLLTDKEPYVRSIGIRFAYDLGMRNKDETRNFIAEVVPQLKKALTHKDGRFAVACALGFIAGPDAEAAVPILVEKGHINSNSLAALKAIGPNAKAAIPALAAFLTSDDYTTSQVEAAELLAGFGPDAGEAIPAMLKLLASLEPAPVPNGLPPTFLRPFESQLERPDNVRVRQALEKLGHKNKKP